MPTFSGTARDLMFPLRFPDEPVIDVPINRGILPGMGGTENKALLFAAEALGEEEDGVVFGIDDVDVPVVLVFTPGFHGRQGFVVDMIMPVIVFLCGREDEPGDADDAACRTSYSLLLQ